MSMRTPASLLISALILSSACRPPEAPDRLDALSSYLFSHVMTEDPEHLEVGIGKLRTWLKRNLKETEAGYEVNNLNQEQVDQLDNCKRDASGLLGAAVATRSGYDIEDMVRTNISVPATKVYPAVVFSRRMDFTPDRECFLDQECEFLQYRTMTEQDFPLGLNVRSKNGIQHRWVETEQGTANVYRTWLQKPAIVSWDWLHVDTQFYLSVAMPWEDGTIRLQATWAATEFGSSPVPETTALNQAIDTMRKTDEAVAEYLGVSEDQGE